MTTYGVDRSGAAGGTGSAVTPVDAAVVTAKGDLIVGTASGAVDNLAAGTNEKRLVADSAEPTGLKYVADTVNYAVAAKGDLLVGTAADTVAPVTVGANGKVLMAEAAQASGVAWNEVPLPRSYLAGFALANGTDATNDIDFAVGAARDSTNTVNLVAATAMTKQLDAAWAAGTGAGGRMSAAAIANTTYHLFAIRKDSDGTIDFGFDTSPTAPTMPSGYTYFRRIGSILRESAAIVGFVQKGDRFFRKVPATAGTSGDNPGTSALLLLAGVPLGLKVIAQIGVTSGFDRNNATDAWALVTDPDTTDTAANTNIANAGQQFNMGSAGTANRTAVGLEVPTNTSGQVRARLASSAAGSSVNITAMGWIDSRGRDD